MDSLNFAHASKARQLSRYFQAQGRIHIVVNSTVEGVDLPEHLMNDPGLNLLLNVRMPKPIEIQASGVSATLSFSGQPYHCHIPLDAIWAAYVPGQEIADGLVWDEALPDVVRAVVEMTQADSTEKADDKQQAKSATKHAPKLRVIK